MVAAMTLPTLVNNKQNKELQTQFKKVYSELNQMSRLFYKDYGMSVSEYLGGTSNGSATYQKLCAYYALADKHPSEEGKNYWQDFLGSK